MLDNTQFESLVRRKIAGWYSTPEFENKAVARMVKQRQEIINLLSSTQGPGIDNVIEYLDKSGFFYRASSPNGHHNFPGGLAEHSLGTYKLAESRGRKAELPDDSVIIAALLHDTCKADRFWFKGRNIRQHTPKCEMDSRHSVRSVVILKDCGLNLTPEEYRAIRWHMKGPFYHSRNPKLEREHAQAVKEKLWKIVFLSDKMDAAAHPGRKNNYICNKRTAREIPI